MNKSELIDFIAKEVNLPKTQCEKVLNAAIKGIKKSLKKGSKVVLVGLGTFKISKRAARKGRDPRTGEEIRIPATVVPVFRAGKALKEEVKK
jgi:nucleoid DNA-binding protein